MSFNTMPYSFESSTSRSRETQLSLTFKILEVGKDRDKLGQMGYSILFNYRGIFSQFAPIFIICIDRQR